MKTNSNNKRNQLDNYLSEVQDAERKSKRKTALFIFLLATVGIGASIGIWYFKEEKVVYRTFVADDMSIYKMDSIFQKEATPVILTYKYTDDRDTVSSVDEYLSLDGVIDMGALTNEEDLLGPENSDLSQDNIPEEPSETTKTETEERSIKSVDKPKKQREKTQTPTLPRYIFDVAGNRVAGNDLAFKIENYDPKVVYVLDFGNGQRQRIRESKTYSYPKSGNYNLKLIASNSKGARSIYSKSLAIEDAPKPKEELVQNNTGTENATAKQAPSLEKDTKVQEEEKTQPINDLLTLAENSEISVEKEKMANPEVSLTNSATNSATSAPLTFAEKMPSFPGGAKSMYKFLNKKLQYPRLARDNEVQGKVYVQFLVATDGSLSNFKVVRGLGFGCDEEALRIAKLMPKWVPGEHGGQKVAVVYTLAVNYKF